MNKVSVRWHDGYLEEFDAEEVRFGSDLLWLRLTDGKNRHIPLRSVRWFGMSQESHQSCGDSGSAWARATASWTLYSTGDENSSVAMFRCGRCGCSSRENYPYCPKCGAQMLGSQNKELS